MQVKINIIPKTDSLKILDGEFCLTKSDAINCPVSSIAGEFLAKLTGLKKSAEGRIKLRIDHSVKGNEAYTLSINENEINISASNDAGLFYGVQTLRQILPASIETETVEKDITIPCAKITDKPRYKYRGFMLDVARHFFDVATIKSLLDLMALHKLNRIHWHLTDDQGFRIQIDQYPRLMNISSQRKRSQIQGMELPLTRKYDNTPHGGFYTKQDIKDVVDYAKKRHIEVIPEIDFPGHFVSVLAAYPELSCRGKQMDVWIRWGISKDVLCVGKEKSMEFVKDIFAEAVELFPYKHIHIGGDETPTKRWKTCPDCQKLKRKLGYKNERQLQTYFMNEISEFLKQKGCKVIGWDEILKGIPDEDIIVQSWSPQGGKRVIESIKHGRKCIVSNYFKYYLDHAYSIATLENAYKFNPRLEGLTDDEAQNILGVEAPLWTEVVDTIDRIHWQMFPRLTAVSESAWTHECAKDYDDFLLRLGAIEKRYEALGVTSADKQCYMYTGKMKVAKLVFNKVHPALVEYKRYRKFN